MLRMRIAQDLAGWPLQDQPQGFQLQLDEQLAITVTLTSKRLFMAAIGSSQFHCMGRCSVSDAGRIHIVQPGWWRRKPVQFRAKHAAGSDVAAHLNSYPNLCQTLGELEYRRIDLYVDQQGWRCMIEPWAASELVCRMPPVRRYLRLDAHQRMLLLSSMKMISEAFSRLNPPESLSKSKGQGAVSPCGG